MDYKNTLNLPQTGFPMKANLANSEPKRLKSWTADNLYQQIRNQSKGRPQFVLHDGPPYANGAIHIGHAVNKVLKDMIIKCKSLDGFDTPYIPGWDCHGLPIELMVEKKVGKAGHKVTAKEFRQRCRDYASKQIAVQREEFIRLGIFGEWHKPYLTMDFAFEADIVRSLATIISNGHLVRGVKPVHWCCDCASALAEAEVEHQDKQSPAVDVAFTFCDEGDFFDRVAVDNTGSGALSVVIWTTTPWTLPANRAVALHGELDYVLVQCDTTTGAQRLLVAAVLLDEVMGRYGIAQPQVIAKCRGADLEGLLVQHPFYQRQVPIILGDHVTTQAGTGAVHTAPGHGQDDFVVGKKYDLPIDNPVDSKGVFLPNTELFAGQYVFRANEQILELLTKNGKLLASENITHSYPHCWRHKTPIIFRATSQWFIAMDKKQLRAKSLQQIKQVKWIPDWGEARIAGMVASRPDWCISRQRTWGTPLALFVHKQTGQLHPDTGALLETVACKIAKHGVDAWFDLAPAELLGADADHYDKITDTLDVWFDSGVSHSAVLQQSRADLYLEGSDQHRGWFQSSLLTSVANHDSAPYKEVLTHGFVVDADGKKMSKSKGNVVAPQTIVKTLGADVLRLWVASVDYSGEINISDEILKRTADSYRRLRNTSRFLLANLHDFDPATDSVANADMLALDRWVLDQAYHLQNEVIDCYNRYQFQQIYQSVHNFCAMDLGGFYLDIIKDRQYTSRATSLARRSGQTAMYRVLEALTRWLAPILSYTADEVWQFIPGERPSSVFLSLWYEGLVPLDAKAPITADIWHKVIATRQAVAKEIEKLRSSGDIGSSQAACVTIYCNREYFAALQHLADELHFVFITSDCQLLPDSDCPSAAIATSINGIKLQVTPSPHPKCIRCWYHSPDVGKDPNHPEICGRCVCNVQGAGETRRYA